MGESAKAGTSIASLRRQYNVSADTVRRWKDEASSSSPNYADAPRSGRPRTLSQAQRIHARRQARAGHTVPQITRSANRRSQQQVSTSTVRRALKVSSRPYAYTPVVRGRQLSTTNAVKRTVFATKYRTGKTGRWVFGDSKLTYMYKDGTGKQRLRWCRKGTTPRQAASSNPYQLMFYGFVAKGFKSPLWFVPPSAPSGSRKRRSPESFASKHIIALLPKIKASLQQAGRLGPRYPLVLDHAKQHTSKASKQAIKEHNLHLLDDFPAQSWDINIIEVVWGVLVDKLNSMRGRMPETADGWRKRIKLAWDSIDQATIDKLVDSVKGRLDAVAAGEGQWLSEHS